MSGGSYDYACYTLRNNFIEEFEKNLNNDTLRIAFLDHLLKVEKAMHDIEWVDTGDYGDGDEHEAILSCLAPTGIDETVKTTIRDIANNLLALTGHSISLDVINDRVDIEEGRKLYELMQADSGPGDINTDNYHDWAADNAKKLIEEIEQHRGAATDEH